MAQSKNSSRMQRQVDLTTAVCQERLLATHLQHVLALVDLTAPRLPFDDALDIYVRMLRLTPEQARNVGSRALAELGRRNGLPTAEEPLVEPEDEPLPEAREGEARSDALFSRLRRRIRGRVQDELRFRINLAGARAEDAIFDTDVENALTFVKAVGDEMGAPAAVELYLDTMMIPEGRGDVIYNRALGQIAESTLPPVPAAGAAPAATIEERA